MLADLSGCGLTYSPPPPPPPPFLSVAALVGPPQDHCHGFSSILSHYCDHNHATLFHFIPLLQQLVFPITYIRASGNSHSPSADRERPSADSKAVSGSQRLTKKGGNSKMTLQSSVSRIIPYRQQQLELEFATIQTPTVGQMANMSRVQVSQRSLCTSGLQVGGRNRNS